MNETPYHADPNASQTSGDRHGPRKRGSLPLWLWILLAGALVLIAILIAIPLLSGTGGGGADSSTPNVTPSASPSPTPSKSATPTPTPTAPDVGQGTFDSGVVDDIATILNSQNTAVLDDGGIFSDPVFVVVANSSTGKDMTPYGAVVSMGGMFTPVDPNPWDLALAANVLDTYRSGPFGQYFPDGAIVARSHDGHVFSFIGHDSTITTMFMASSEGLLH